MKMTKNFIFGPFLDNLCLSCVTQLNRKFILRGKIDQLDHFQGAEFEYYIGVYPSLPDLAVRKVVISPL